MNIKKQVKIIFIIIVAIILFIPYYLSFKVEEKVKNFINEFSILGFEIEKKYQKGYLNSDLTLVINPIFNKNEKYSLYVQVKIKHGPIFFVDDNLHFGLAAANINFYWQQNLLNEARLFIRANDFVNLKFLPLSKAKNFSSFDKRIQLLNWRGFSGKIAFDTDKESQLLQLNLDKFQLKQNDLLFDFADTSFKASYNFSSAGLLFKNLEIKNPEISIINKYKNNVANFLENNYLFSREKHNSNESLVLNIKSKIEGIYNQETNQLLVQLKFKKFNSYLFKQAVLELWHKNNLFTGAFDAINKLSHTLPEINTKINIITAKGDISLTGGAYPKNIKNNFKPSLAWFNPSQVVLNLIEAQAVLTYPVILEKEFSNWLVNNGFINYKTKKNIDNIYEQLKSRKAITQKNDYMQADFRVEEGNITLNHQPVTTLLLSIAASMLLN